MKKATVIVQSADSAKAVKSLRTLGALHVEHQNQPSGKDINRIKDDIAVLDKVINILSSPGSGGKSGVIGAEFAGDWRSAAKHIIDTAARIDHLAEYSGNLKAQIDIWSQWGDFDPDAISDLKARGINVRLCKIPSKEIKSLSGKYIIKLISSSKGSACCVLISRGAIEVPYKDEGLPKMSLSGMKARMVEDNNINITLAAAIQKQVPYLGVFTSRRNDCYKELEFQEALRGMGEAGNLSYIAGYVPADKVGDLTAMAKTERWALLVKEPSAEDNVPTLVRSPRWVSIIAPMFKLIEIVPGYNEMDISPVFLLFLSLFFGMIIGDAGYGAIYIALTLFIQKKVGARMKDHRIFHLLYLFSASAIMWGIVTGTVFGQEWYLKAGFKAAIPILNDTKFLQAFCFFLGAVHLTIAQTWQGLRKIPSLTALADAGWICVLWAAFFLARMLILSDPLPGFTNKLLILGVLLVIFFTNPQRNVLKMVSEGLGTVALNIMNNFTDVVSYIRLFAVGLAGVAISDTVNTLASSVSGGNILIHSIIIFLGHTINIVLGPMSVLVHGIRLNVLEFSSHAGLTWSGTRYRPLEDTQK